MTITEIIKILEGYEVDLGQILSRFSRTSSGIHINRNDDPRFRTIVIELRDLLNDILGENSYSSMIIAHFNEGRTNFLQSPSFKSVEDIRSVVSSIITRIKRNPSFFIKTQHNIPALQEPRGIKSMWTEIQKDYDISKTTFGKKINFVRDNFKRKIIFRDVEHAYALAASGFSKPAVILAGGVIEELLRLYLDHKKITPANRTFDGYIKACEQYGLLKSAIHRLTDSVRHFRNIVHLEKESSARITISKATAKGAVASIFTIANDF